MLRQNLKELKQNKKQGISLPFVACAGALLLAFALAMVYTAGVMLSNANSKLEEEQCYQLAKSFSEVVGKQLQTPASEFYKFADKFLNEPAYNEYNPDHPETLYHYVLDTPEDENYGKVTLQLRKETNEDGMTNLTGSLSPPAVDDTNYSNDISTLENKTFRRYLLTVEVVAQKGDLAYNYATEYYREDKYRVIFEYNGTKIVWSASDNKWKEGTVEGPDCNFADASSAMIEYTYNIDDPVSTSYKPVHEERGTS